MILANTFANASRGRGPGVNETTRQRSFPDNGCLPKAGIKPALARDWTLDKIEAKKDRD